MKKSNIINPILTVVAGIALIIVPMLIKSLKSLRTTPMTETQSNLVSTMIMIVTSVGIITTIFGIFNFGKALLMGNLLCPVTEIKPEDLDIAVQEDKPKKLKPKIEIDIPIYGCDHCGRLYVPNKHFHGFLPECPSCGATIKLLNSKDNIQESEG